MKGSLGLRKGTWCKEEDELLGACVHRYGEGNWHLISQRPGLNRCRKSCRLRWLNYLKPNIKRGDFAEDEIDMMIRMQKLLGNRWSLIAGRLPGRTANDVKNFWNTFIRKNKSYSQKDEKNEKPKETTKTHVVIQPQAHIFSKNSPWIRWKLPTATSNQPEIAKNSCSSSQASVVSAASASPQSPDNSWERLLYHPAGSKEGDITCCLSGLDGNFINELWYDDGEFTGMNTKDNDLLMEDPIDWSDFLPLDTNLL